MDEGAANRLTEPPVVPWVRERASPQPAGIGTYGGGRPSFTVGGLLRDTFARYAADPLRLVVVAALPTALTFSTSLILNPYTNPSAAAIAPVLGLVGLLLGIIGIPTTFALLEGGRELGSGLALGRGFQRSGWLVVTVLILGLLAIVLGFALVIALTIVLLVLLLAPWPLLIAVQLGSFVVFGWFAVRLGLAIPAVIVDNLTPVDAIKLAWRVTAPARVWLPVFGAGVLLGLLVIPISFGTVVLDFPAMFGQVTPFAAVSLVVGIGLAPIGASFAYSAYRRLVPPFWPPWTRMPVAIVGGDGTLTFPPPAFVVPPYGPAAKTIVALLVALAIAGLALVAYGVTQFLSGHVVIPLPPMFPYSPGQQGFPPLFTFPPFPSFGP